MPDAPLSAKDIMEASSNVAVVTDIRLDGPEWAVALPGIETLAREAVFETLRQASPEHLMQQTEISLMFTDDQRMRALNSRYRGKDQTTNVLSFACDAAGVSDDSFGDADGPKMLGDVVLAFGRVRDEVAKGGLSLSHHVMHLVAHGVLHLLGHDHEQGGEQAKAMETCETAILLALGVDNPYQSNNTNLAKDKHEVGMEASDHV